MNNIVILSPHPDDGLLACGATINRFIEEGKEIHYIIFSTKEQGFSDKEITDSIIALGVKRKNIICFDYPTRRFDEHRQEILQELVDLRSKLAPELVLCHSSADTHQDHKVVQQEAFRAFKQVSIWGYDLPWNTRNFRADIFVGLEKRHIDKKIQGLSFIKSQETRSYYNPYVRLANAIAVGEKIKRDYAEMFESISQIT